MSRLEVSLSPRLLGGEVLAKIARARATGVLTWVSFGAEAKLNFKDGRPVSAEYNQGQLANERSQVVGFVRGFATLIDGTCVFDPAQPVNVEQAAAGIDTLGEILVAVLKGLSKSSLDSIWAARGAFEIEPKDSFDKFAGAIEKMGGPKIHKPLPNSVMAPIVTGIDREKQRAWTALFALGAVKVLKAPAPTPTPTVSGVTEHTSDPRGRPVTGSYRAFDDTEQKPTPSASYRRPITGRLRPGKDGRPTTGPAKIPANIPQMPDRPATGKRRIMPPKDPEARAVFFEIEKEAERLGEDKSHYEFFGIDKGASPDLIKRTYFDNAKKWHSDRLSGLDLHAEMIEKAGELFRRTEEAWRILSDKDERKTYDYILDRAKRGLPTDPKVIMEAENLFKKGEALVRQGKPERAVPMFEAAIDKNPGEGEFFIYHGFAIYCARGGAAWDEANLEIKKGMEMHAESDAAFEFLGRIARMEGNRKEAERNLKRALEINPRNVDAARELRLLTMRQTSGRDRPATDKSIGGMLGKFFKK